MMRSNSITRFLCNIWTPCFWLSVDREQH